MRWFVLFALLLALLAGCGPEASPAPTPAPTSASAPASTPAYPGPAGAYPGPTESGYVPGRGYPDPSLPQGPKFTINKPVKATDTQVTGTGPAGVPIKLLDYTDGGATLAATTIGGDGKFTFDVAGKLKAKNKIVLKLGDLAGTNLKPENFISGPGYDDLAFIGVTFDSAEIQ